MKTATSKNASFQQGVTLVELLAVLAIMALSATLSVVAIRGPTDQMRLQQTADRMVADLRRSAAAAKRRGKVATVTFEVDSYSASIITDRPFVLPDGMTVDTDEPVDIDFHPDGYSPGGEVLLHFNDKSLLILVHPYSGRVRVVS